MTVDTQDRVTPRDHLVLFYESIPQLVTTVAQFVVDGVQADETSIVVATAPHIAAFEDALVAAGVDVDAARADGTLLIVDATQAMSSFLIGDWPQAGPFETAFGQLIRRVSDSGRPVRVYGEMVALLWDGGHIAAAIELEALWNELGRHVPFSLLCAYPASSVTGDDDSFQLLCHCHSAVVDTHPQPPRARVTRSFFGDSSSLRGARQFVLETLRWWGLDALCDDAAIMVSELATNAILHARSDFTVTLAVDGDNVRLSVHDASTRLPVVRDRSPTSISGRGLVLVAALGAKWGTEAIGDGKEVWVELRG